VNIAFANEVARACERMGVDVFELRGLINARPDRNMHIAGAGVGGHCLPKDSWLLKYGLETYGEHSAEGTGKAEDRNWAGLRLIPLAREINDGMPHHMLALIEETLAEAGRELAGATVTLLGVAYLENADDTRNTPAAALAKLLLARGATVMAHDPYVREADWKRALDTQFATHNSQFLVPLTSDLWEALDGADCAALVTRHREYQGLNLQRVKNRMNTPAVVDGRNVFALGDWLDAGFAARAVGKG
jgi:UDP-N-acetyl-D-mannosaminuronic acid dehydrogenase